MTDKRVVYGLDDELGIRRHGRSRFRYTDDRHGGRAVADDKVLGRIRRLAVPPAWTDVWISADPSTHIQATGRDARGRKQYRYHGAYRSRRDQTKFDQLVPFGRALPSVRQAVERDLHAKDMGHDEVVALVVALLDRTLLRVGNESYARDNGSFGLTTLRHRHAHVDGRTIRLHFRAKSAKDSEVAWTDARLARLVRQCRDLPGHVLFQWLDGHGGRHPVRSDDVNAYLRRVTALDATAKTFRTWGATLLAAVGFVAVADTAPRLRAQVSRDVITAVAAELGNTPAVCRASYVHPAVVEAFQVGTMDSLWRASGRRPRQLLLEEQRLLHLLEHVESAPLPLRPDPDGRSRSPRGREAGEELAAARRRAERSVDRFATSRRAR